MFYCIILCSFTWWVPIIMHLTVQCIINQFKIWRNGYFKLFLSSNPKDCYVSVRYQIININTQLYKPVWLSRLLLASSQKRVNFYWQVLFPANIEWGVCEWKLLLFERSKYLTVIWRVGCVYQIVSECVCKCFHALKWTTKFLIGFHSGSAHFLYTHKVFS